MSRWLSKAAARLRTLLQPAVVFVGGASVDEARAQFEAWAREHAGSVCEIGLGGAWVHTCVVPAEVAEATQSDDEAWLDYARLQFEHYFGISAGLGGAWTLAASRDARAALVCAVSSELLAVLRAVASAHHVSVRRVAPWWARGAQAALREELQSGWQGDASGATARVAAAVEPGRTTLVVAQDGRIVRVVGEASGAPHDWRARLQDSAGAASLWSFKLTADEPEQLDQLARTLRGQIEPELVFQRIEGAA